MHPPVSKPGHGTESCQFAAKAKRSGIQEWCARKLRKTWLISGAQNRGFKSSDLELQLTQVVVAHLYRLKRGLFTVVLLDIIVLHAA